MRTGAAATAALVAVAGLACGKDGDTSADPALAHTISVLEGLIQEELDAGVPSISLSLLVGDEVVWSGAYGYANVGLKAPATTESLYNTASTLKPVTATAVLTLVEQGRLGLDDPVNLYLGEHRVMDDPGNSVTVRSLLDHTSGLSDELGQTMTSVVDRQPPHPVALHEIPGTMNTRWPVGDRWRYNNSAYAVAGLLVEKLSGMSYEEYIVARVLTPLGVAAAHPVNPTDAMAEMMTFPYLEDPDGSFRPVARTWTDLYPAGDAWVRPQDMIRFLGAHLNGGVFGGSRILSQELVEEAHRANMEDYGLGWWTRLDEQGHRLILHGGMGHGYSVTMIGDKDARVGVYAMANASTQANYRVADAAVKLLRGDEYSGPVARVAVDLELAQLNRLTGMYWDDDFESRVEVTAIDGRLLFEYLDLNPGSPLVFYPESDTRFFQRGSFDLELEFREGDDGEIEGFRMRQFFLDYGFFERLPESR